jgi:DNA-binding transcriptional regulator YiaG
MPDKRRKPYDPDAERPLRDAFEQDIATNSLSIPQTIRAMRRLSRLTQPEFAKHRGISIGTLKDLESGRANPTVETLNQIAGIFGLEVGFVRKRKG